MLTSTCTKGLKDSLTIPKVQNVLTADMNTNKNKCYSAVQTLVFSFFYVFLRFLHFFAFLKNNLDFFLEIF